MAGRDPTLPHIDEHEIRLAVPAADAWPAVIAAFDALACRPVWRIAASVLGCEPQTATGDREKIGATVPGFRVTRSQPSTEWALEGQHRLARYELVFRIEPVDGRHSRVRAVTSARFPGRRGAAYRALVIGTGSHVVGVRAILRSVKRRAERAP